MLYTLTPHSNELSTMIRDNLTQTRAKSGGYLHRTAIFLLVLLWAYTGLDKLVNHALFSNQLALQFLPKIFIPALSYLIPISEISIALLLFWEKSRKQGLILSLSLLLIFTIYIALAVLGSRERVPCACAGIFKDMGWTMHLIINVFFLVLCIYALKNTNQKGGSVERQ